MASALGIDASRLAVELTPTNPDRRDRYTAEATITHAGNTTIVSAYDAANVFLAIWAAPYSAQAYGLNPMKLELDEAVQPRLSYLDQAPSAPEPGGMPDEEPGVTQGLHVPEVPEIGPPMQIPPPVEIAPPLPIDVSGPLTGGGKHRSKRAASSRVAPGQVEEEKGSTWSSYSQRMWQGYSGSSSIPRATIKGVAAAFALVATLALVGVYAVRRQRTPARARTRSVLRVQSVET